MLAHSSSSPVKTFFWALWFTFAYTLTAAATALVIGFFAQTHELYRAFAQQSGDHIAHIAILVGMLALFTYVLWQVVDDSLRASAAVSPRPGQDGIGRFFAATIASAVPAAAALGVIAAACADPIGAFDDRSSLPEPFGGLIEARIELQIVAGLLAACTVLFWIAAFRWSGRLANEPLRRLARFKYFPAGFVLFALIAWLIWAEPLAVPRFFGAASLVLLFGVCLALFLRFFYTWPHHRNAIALLALVGWIVILTVTEKNDYKVDQETDPAITGPRMSVADAFKAWLDKRGDRDRFARPGVESQGKAPYPVFLVAASGGGIYSARHTALTLARIIDNCPRFAQHLFAISGISGGSWGSALFHTLAKEIGNPDEKVEVLPCGLDRQERAAAEGSYQKRTEAFLARDFLSPLIGAGLFPNMFQWVWPQSVASLNRSYIFEQIVEDAFPADIRPNPLERTVSSVWDYKGSGGALILNVTDADRGYQRTAAPFTIRGRSRQDAQAFELVQTFMNEPPSRPRGDQARDDQAPTGAVAREAESSTPPKPWRDVRVATAVAMSAGFPVFIGAGNLRNKERGETLRLVDGGYYENSGTEALLQIIDQIRAKERDFEISIHVIVLDSRYPPGEQGTLASPLKALLSTRALRSQVAITNLYDNRAKANEVIQARCNALGGGGGVLCDENRALREAPPTFLDGEDDPDLRDSAPGRRLPQSCAEQQSLKFPHANQRYGRLRPAQISLDLHTFDVPLAFYLSANGRQVVDAFSGSSVCSTAPPVVAFARSEKGAVKAMMNRLQCNIDLLCGTFRMLKADGRPDLAP